MISNEKLQATLVAALKGKSTITDLLANDDDIKEDQWQGDSFVYPAIRVKLGTQTPENDTASCEWAFFNFIIECFASDASSKSTDVLAGAVNDFLHKKALNGDGYRMHRIRSVGLLSARRISSEVWQADAMFETSLHTVS